MWLTSVFRLKMVKKLPIVIIVGPTGVGKTKLSLALAQKYKTEVISADSMQIYKGLDVVTAKATVEERSLVPHHLMDILEPHQIFTVVDFRSRALKIIDDLTAENKLPLVVGGTNYYIESIVYKILVETSNDPDSLLWDISRRKRDGDDGTGKTPVKKRNIEENPESSKTVKEGTSRDDTSKVDVEKLKEDVNNEKMFTNEEIHSKLQAIDPVMADRLHPNNRRKILRAIEVWLNTGRRQSDLLAEQKADEGRLRRPGETVMLWLTCDQEVHDRRLNDRVDQMIADGLLQELLNFHDKHNKHRLMNDQPADYTKGIFQTLGFKEFHDYLMMTEEEKQSDKGKHLLLTSIESMKIATRRYARRQNKMVKGRFLAHPNREVPPIFTLDTTDLTKWDEEVESKAIEIIESFIHNTPCKYEPLKSTLTEEKKNINPNSRNFCDVCQRIIIGDKCYAEHMVSVKHKKVLKKAKALETETKNN